MNTLRQQPRSQPHRDFSAAIQFDEALIGSLLLNPSAIVEIETIVSSVDFFDADLAALFDLMTTLAAAGGPVADIKLLKAEIDKSEIQIDAARLAELFSDVPNARNAKYYAANVLEHSKRRALVELGVQVQSAAVDAAMNVDDQISNAEQLLTGLSTRTTSGIQSIESLADAVIDRINSPNTQSLVTTGIQRVDRLLGGFRPGEMIVIAARPGCGKTSLAWQIADRTSRQLRHVLFVSLEMTAKELVERAICGDAGISVTAVRQGDLTSRQKTELSESADRIKCFPIDIADPPAATMRKIEGIARLKQSRDQLDLLVVDYLGLVRPANPKATRYEQATEDSKAVKRLAKTLNVPVIVLSQLNREAATNTPRLCHLRDSGSIEQDADIVILLHADNNQCHRMIVAKNRHGRIGNVELFFDGPRTRFVELERGHK